MTAITMTVAAIMASIGMQPKIDISATWPNEVWMERERIVQEVAPDDDPGFDVEYPCPDKQAVA